MKLYFVRHGESVANVEKVVSNRGFQHPLTDKGRQQVMNLADSLKAVEIAHIFTSPLQRAVQTAEILSNAKGIPYEIRDALCEGDCGILEGRGDDECWRLMGAMNSQWFNEGNYDAKVEDGESYHDIVARFAPFVEKLVDTYADTDASILLVSHGSTLRVGLSHLLINIDPYTVFARPMTNAGYIEVVLTTDGLRCIEWCGETVSEE